MARPLRDRIEARRGKLRRRRVDLDAVREALAAGHAAAEEAAENAEDGAAALEVFDSVADAFLGALAARLGLPS